MTSAEQLQAHIDTLRAGLSRNVGGDTLDYLVSNVKAALGQSLDNGDTITVAEFGTKLTTRLQALSAINQGYLLQVTPSS